MGTSGMLSDLYLDPYQELLIINTIIPLKFAYEIHIGNDSSELLFDWAQKIKPEKKQHHFGIR